MQDMPWIGAASPRSLSHADFTAAAARLGCLPSALQAVWEVEASGRCFDAVGGVLARFEPHHMPREHWGALGFDPAGRAAWRTSLALRETDRRAMFLIAARIDTDAALIASSWGGPQIMGFNAAAAGFASARAMVGAMATGAPAHLDAFVSLVTSWGLDAALRGQDWLAFATRYNGSGQPEVYAARIEAAFRRHSGAPSPVALRVGDRGPAVVTLQRALGVPDDGAFGPGTLAAVEAFQQRAGLPIDGVVGARTWGALGAAPPVAGTTPAPPPAQASTGEARVDRLGQIAGLAAPAAAAVPLVGAARESVSPVLWEVATWGAVALIALWALPWVVRRVRGVSA